MRKHDYLWIVNLSCEAIYQNSTPCLLCVFQRRTKLFYAFLWRWFSVDQSLWGIKNLLWIRGTNAGMLWWCLQFRASKYRRAANRHFEFSSWIKFTLGYRSWTFWIYQQQIYWTNYFRICGFFSAISHKNSYLLLAWIATEYRHRFKVQLAAVLNCCCWFYHSVD